MANNKQKTTEEPQSILDFRNQWDFEDFVAAYSEIWLENPTTHKNKIALPFSISPRELDKYWQNKDDARDPIPAREYKNKDGVVKKGTSPTSRNSHGNRPPNWKSTATRADKIIYWLANIAYVRDYNVLPLSMIINVKGKKQFNTLLAKDRGTFNFYHTKKHEKLKVSFWSKLLTILDETEYKDNVKIKAIISRITELVAVGKEFSMIESVPGNIWEQWYNDKSYIHIRMKFETYKDHKNDMKRLNNSTNPWVEHNHIMADVITPLPINQPNTYKMETLDLIYGMVCKHNLFSGDEFLNVPNQKVEEFEGFLPWLFTSLDYRYKSDLETIQSILARGNDANFKLKSLAYEKAYRENCKVDAKTGIAGYKMFEDKTDLMVRISENVTLKKYRNAHRKYCESLGVKSKRSKNITDLTVSKWDTFLMISHCISHIIREVHNARGFTNERVDDITKLFFDEAINLLNDSSVTSNLKSFTGGFQYRYEHFWKIVTDNVADTKRYQMQGNFDITLLQDVLVADIESKGFAVNEVYEMYDRESSTQVKPFFPYKDTPKPGQNGHLIPTEPVWYGNIVIQPPLDNKYNDNKPIKDIQKYIDEYMSDVKSTLGEDVNPVTLMRTEVYLNSWFNQKNYKIV